MIREIVIGDLPELSDVVDEICGQDVSKWGFRGQADKAWRLESTLTREIRRLGWSASRAIDAEIYILREFKAGAHLAGDVEYVARSDDACDWWALMQHHGAPTRLLDWSRSPYIAAFFASEDSMDTDGIVWGLHSVDAFDCDVFDAPAELGTDDLEKVRDELHMWEDSPTLFLTQRHYHSDRMLVQQGRFSLSSQVAASHDSMIEQDRVDVFKVVIPREIKPKILATFRQMNISRLSLFPGLDGMAQSWRGWLRSKTQHEERSPVE